MIVPLTTGDNFGECDLLYSSSHLLTAIAVRECELFSITLLDLKELCGAYTTFSGELRAMAADRLKSYEAWVGRKLAGVGLMDVLAAASEGARECVLTTTIAC